MARTIGEEPKNGTQHREEEKTMALEADHRAPPEGKEPNWDNLDASYEAPGSLARITWATATSKNPSRE